MTGTDNGVTLRGIGWDHPRCMRPLDASVAAYASASQNIQWDTRSLYAFGEGRLDKLVEEYDLIIFDHPYVGEIAQNGTFVNLLEYLTDAQIAGLSQGFVGSSWRSYEYDIGLWGLPVDAATQVAACRCDLLERNGLAVPSSLDDVFKLASALRPLDLWIAVPLNSVDAFCTVLTLTANMGAALNVHERELFDVPALKEALEILQQLVAVAHPKSTAWNPIACFDYMCASDEVAYVPYAFGYTNYSRIGRDKTITFHDIPSSSGDTPIGALVGGAGIAISENCQHKERAIEYAIFLSSREFQSGEYFASGGQPASIAAWESIENNCQSGDFFKNTRRSMDNGYLRPRYSGFVPFLRESAPVIHAFLLGNISQEQAITTMLHVFDTTVLKRAADV